MECAVGHVKSVVSILLFLGSGAGVLLWVGLGRFFKRPTLCAVQIVVLIVALSVFVYRAVTVPFVRIFQVHALGGYPVTGIQWVGSGMTDSVSVEAFGAYLLAVLSGVMLSAIAVGILVLSRIKEKGWRLFGWGVLSFGIIVGGGSTVFIICMCKRSFDGAW